jgi:hypothetical protein
MTRPRGRPREFHGPIINVKLPALTHIQASALAKVKGQTLSQVVRESLTEAMAREWGTGQ